MATTHARVNDSSIIGRRGNVNPSALAPRREYQLSQDWKNMCRYGKANALEGVTVRSTSFMLSDHRSVSDRFAMSAVADAASCHGLGGGCRITGSPLIIDDLQRITVTANAGARRCAMAAEAAPAGPVIAPGSTTIRESVRVVFALQPAINNAQF